MQIRIRDTCPTCGGTGLNGLTYEEAQEQIMLDSMMEVLDLTGLQISTGELTRKYMVCPKCVGGFVEGWKDAREAVLQALNTRMSDKPDVPDPAGALPGADNNRD